MEILQGTADSMVLQRLASIGLQHGHGIAAWPVRLEQRGDWRLTTTMHALLHGDR